MMKPIICILSILFLLDISSVTNAQPTQTSLSSELVGSSMILNKQLGIHDDDVYLLQVGANNNAIISQFSGMDRENGASLTQIGLSQFIQVQQNGSGNMVDLSQVGFNNSIRVWEYGEGINSRIFQMGAHNKVHQLLGTSNQDYSILQIGNGHELIDVSNPLNTPGYTIRQMGLIGMKVTIQSR